MIAEVHLPKNSTEGKDLNDMYDEERQGEQHLQHSTYSDK